jgi:hypothetical protein
MKTLKRLPIILALLVTIFVSACSEIDVDPRGDGDGDPIVIKPKPTGSSVAPADTVSIG